MNLKMIHIVGMGLLQDVQEFLVVAKKCTTKYKGDRFEMLNAETNMAICEMLTKHIFSCMDGIVY